MRCALLPAVLLVVSAGAHAQTPEASGLGGSGGRILLVTPAPRLGVDLPGMERDTETLVLPSVPVTNVGSRGRAAWRGAKRGFLVGLAIGAAVTTAVAVSESCNPGSKYVCDWYLAAAATVPFAILTTGAGAAIGAATARPAPPMTLPAEAPRSRP